MNVHLSTKLISQKFIINHLTITIINIDSDSFFEKDKKNILINKPNKTSLIQALLEKLNHTRSSCYNTKLYKGAKRQKK